MGILPFTFHALDPGFIEIIKPKWEVAPEFKVWKESLACENLDFRLSFAN